MLLPVKRSWQFSMQELLIVPNRIPRVLFNTLSRGDLVPRLDQRGTAGDGYYRSWRLGSWGVRAGEVLVENMVKIMFDIYPMYDKSRELTNKGDEHGFRHVCLQDQECC